MIKLYIVDDHNVVIEGITALLLHEKNITIIGTAKNAADCILFLKNHTADVILLDINLPDTSGIDLCNIIKTTYPRIMILALSTFTQGSYITKMIENGASGYLLKNITKEELVDAIETVAVGKNYYSFEVGKMVKAAQEKAAQVPVLTKREKDILKLVAEGFTNNQIAQQLFISIDTVDTHRKNLYTKLKINNTALLVRYAIENELV